MAKRVRKAVAVVAKVDREHDHGLRKRALRSLRMSSILSMAVSCASGIMVSGFFSLAGSTGDGRFQFPDVLALATEPGSSFLLS